MMFGEIDFSEIAGNMISGLEDNEINEVSCVQNLLRNDPTILDESFESIKILPQDIDERLNYLESEAIPKSTTQQQKIWLKKFTDFVKEQNINVNLENITKEELSKLIRYFYSELRNKSGGYYSKATLLCIRAALYRHFKSERMFDIILDNEFYHANQLLKAMIKKYFENGGSVKRYEAIEEVDMKKLRSYLNRESPETLQQEIYFVIVYYLGLRGREWIKRLKRKQLSFEIDSQGNEYAVFTGLGAMQKNYQPNLHKTKCNPTDGRIYSTDDPTTCPVTALKLFLQKLPESCETFFYKPIKEWKFSNHWYNPNMPMGINTIGLMMNIISKEANLSKKYTGHCIRSTVVTNLFNQGVPIEEISCVTGHQQSNSVKKYLRHVSDEKRMNLSSSLSSSLNAGSVSTPTKSATTSSDEIHFNISSDSTSILQGPSKKKMRIVADGDTNKVEISFH